MNVNMKNNNIICKDIESENTLSQSGFVVTRLDKFKTVIVIHSSEEDVPVGSKVRISVNSGDSDELGLIIKRGDIIYVL